MNSDAPPTGEKKSLAAKILRPKVAIPLLLVFLILLSPFLIRGWHLAQVPDFPEPFDAKPLLEYSVPDDENAFTDYRKAVSLYVPPGTEIMELRDEVTGHGWHLATDEMRQHLDDNEAALLAWRAGTGKDRARYLALGDHSIASDLELLGDIRELHRDALLLCEKIAAEGRAIDAWEWYRASLRTSRHIGTYGEQIERLIGIACFQRTAKELVEWATLPELSRSDLKLVIGQLQADWTLTEKTSTAMKIDYLTIKKTMQNIARDEETSSMLHYLKGEPEVSLRLLRVFYYELVQTCDLPRSERVRQYDDELGWGDIAFSVGDFDRAVTRAPFVALLLPTTAQFQESIDREDITYRCLLVTLAAQAYFRDHGHFPEESGQLIPGYLEEIPTDPFSPTSEPLSYRRTGDDAVVYSRFENEIDDGATEVSFEEGAGTKPLDYGVRIIHPFGRPLTAPKPIRP